MSHEELWALTAEEFTRWVGRGQTSEFSKNSEVYKAAHEETLSMSPTPCPLPPSGTFGGDLRRVLRGDDNEGDPPRGEGN